MTSTSWQVDQSHSSMQQPEKEETHHQPQMSRRNAELLCIGTKYHQTKTTRRHFSCEDPQPEQHSMGIHLWPKSSWGTNPETTSQTLLTGSRHDLYPRPPPNTNQQWMYQQICTTNLRRHHQHWLSTNRWLHQRFTTTPENQDPPTENPANPLNTDELIQGFKRWPERTTTFPSGWHLGIYKSLAKHFPPPKDKNNPEPSPKPQDPLQCGNDILKLLIMMMDLAVTHTDTYDRWKTIWTLLLEKDAGNPKIDRLHTIHLYKQITSCF